ncbi:hypothetical protein IC620_13275 [Hazenella sp. IB182357]|uniref:Uncharacterized protein n=1 Tax=Polycladospora coralii TaxID=2771432 RepID=A0A926RV89_9BACL|nr:hypothetical protein [Polycladospora coralii]MBD1373319.1 hypothetical protein [Polycladospora coralii]
MHIFAIRLLFIQISDEKIAYVILFNKIKKSILSVYQINYSLSKWICMLTGIRSIQL